jgi:hypothetical protein
MTNKLKYNLIFIVFLVFNCFLIFQKKSHSGLRDEKRIDFLSSIDDEALFWVENSDKIAYHFLPNGRVKISLDGFKTFQVEKWQYSHKNGRLDILKTTGDTTTSFVEGYETYLDENRINFLDKNLGGEYFNRHSIEYFGTDRKSLIELMKFKIMFAFENFHLTTFEYIFPYFTLLFILFLFFHILFIILLLFLIQAYLKFYEGVTNSRPATKLISNGIICTSLSYYIFKDAGWNSFIIIILVSVAFSFVIRNIFKNYRSKYGIGIPFYQFLTYFISLPLIGAIIFNLPQIQENNDLYPRYYFGKNDIESILYTFLFLGFSILISLLLGRIPYKKGVVIENRFKKTKRVIFWILTLCSILFVSTILFLLLESEIWNEIRPYGSFDFNFYFEVVLFLYFSFYFFGFLTSFFLGYNLNNELRDYSTKSDKKVFLYLRSFNQHNNAFWVGKTSKFEFEFGKIKSKLFSKINYFPDFLTFEEYIGFQLSTNQIRLLGLGSPYDTLPNKNLETLYANNDDWKKNINNLLNDSDKVLFQIGDTENVKYELEEIVRLNHLNKCYVLIPPLTKYLSDRVLNRILNWITYKKETQWSSFQKLLRQVKIVSNIEKVNGGAILGFSFNGEARILAENLELPSDYVNFLLNLENN